jgi:N-sulfoglucosamine sulfohydrolase
MAMSGERSMERPNILIITTDDQGLNAGCYGDPLAITPNLDRLTAEGVLFEKAYAPHASCSPSRATILSGLYSHQHGQLGVANHPEHRFKEGIATLPALLKQAGYVNGILGKLHVNPQHFFPFDFQWALGTPTVTRDVLEVARQAGAFLKQRGDRPFFLYVNYFDPHRPAPGEGLWSDFNQYKGLPENPYGPDDIVPLAFLGLDGLPVREEVAAYYNGIKRMDVGLGLLFDELRQAGVYDQTLILFLGDHGPPFTRAKMSIYEAGEAIPFVIRWPGVSQAGLRSADFVSTIDIVPTVLDAVGVECPPVEGQSLRPVVQGKTPPDWRKQLYSSYASHAVSHFYPRRAVRNERFKLIHNLDHERANPHPYIIATRPRPGVVVDPRWEDAYKTNLHPPEFELYDLSKDPYETTNLAGNPELATVLMELKADLMNWRQQTGDPLLDPAELERLRKAHGFE